MWEYRYPITSDELYHSGRKGQKWGQRLYQYKDGSLTPLGKLRYGKKGSKGKSASKDDKTSSNKKKIEDMSDEELRERINRLNLEQDYRKKMKEINPKTTSKGKEIVKDILEKSAKNVGTQLATYVMGRGINKMFEKTFNDPQIVNPKKGQKDK